MSLLGGLDEVTYKWENLKGFYKGHSRVEKMQIVQDGEGARVIVHEDLDQLDSDQLASWLEITNDPVSTSIHSTTLKLLLVGVSRFNQPSPLSDHVRLSRAEALSKAFKAGRLPLGALAAFSINNRVFAKAHTKLEGINGSSSLLSRYYYNSEYFGIAWAISPSTGIQRAVLLYQDNTTYRGEILAFLSTPQNFIDQPIWLGFISVKLSIWRLRSRVDDRTANLISLKDITGLFTWKLKGWTDDIVDVDTTGLDYGPISRKLSTLAGLANLHRTDLRLLIRFTDLLLQGSRPNVQKSRTRKNTIASNKVEEMVEALEVLKEHIDIILLTLEIIIDEVTSMMSAIYTLIAQRDSLISLDLAKIAQKDSIVGIQLAKDSRTLAIESKRDSSSMKTIAAVTMAFLPCTFVASFFAVPMFDWSKPVGHNVNMDTFWIYWVVTIPLTLSTFLIWGAWFRYKTARNNREDIVEQRELHESQATKEDEGSDGLVQGQTGARGGTNQALDIVSGHKVAGLWSRLVDKRHGVHWRQGKEAGMMPQV